MEAYPISGKIRSQLVSLHILKQKKNWRSAFHIPFRLCGFDSDHVDSFYQEPCYYLDNLCVDFRYQRLGRGSLLLQWGLEVADEKKLCVGTEASPKGHQSNIFVDDGRDVKYLIDLEWTFSLPIEMQCPPYWLTSQTVDGLADDHLTLIGIKNEERILASNAHY